MVGMQSRERRRPPPPSSYCLFRLLGNQLLLRSRSLSYKNPSSGKRSTEPFGKRDSQKILGEGRFSKLAPFPFSCLIKIHLPGRRQLMSSHMTYFYGSSSLQKLCKKMSAHLNLAPFSPAWHHSQPLLCLSANLGKIIISFTEHSLIFFYSTLYKLVQ